MARREIVVLIDDLTGKEDATVATHTFSVDGRTVEIDLSEKSFADIMKALAPAMQKGRRVAAQSNGRAKQGSGNGKLSREQRARFAAWAERVKGRKVSDRGRLPVALLEEWMSLGKPTAPEAPAKATQKPAVTAKVKDGGPVKVPAQKAPTVAKKAPAKKATAKAAA